jgi:glycerol-3-phosphate acyltransferase PlsY
MLEALVKAALAYALGNVMGGHLVGRLRGGVDLRSLGSGNVGATNALRTQGAAFALMVLAIDAGKGLVACLLLPALPWPDSATPWPRDWLAYLCGIAVTLGHCYPAAYGFKGGKGVATLAGVFAALLPTGLSWMLVGFVLVLLLSGYVSLATLCAAAIAGLYVACIDSRGALSALGVFTALMMLTIAFKHRENIGRLWRGEEHRFEKMRVIGRWFER